jgi:hypothetical protein
MAIQWHQAGTAYQHGISFLHIQKEKNEKQSSGIIKHHE